MNTPQHRRSLIYMIMYTVQCLFYKLLYVYTINYSNLRMVLFCVLLRLLHPVLLLLILIPQVILNECHCALAEAHGLEHLQDEDVWYFYRVLCFRNWFGIGKLGELALLVLQLAVIRRFKERGWVDTEDREAASNVESREEESLCSPNEEEVSDRSLLALWPVLFSDPLHVLEVLYGAPHGKPVEWDEIEDPFTILRILLLFQS